MTAKTVLQGILLATAVVLGAAFAADKTGTNNADFALEEVASGVFVHQGVSVPFEDPRHDDVANIGFIVGEQCVAVIDSGGSLEIGRRLRASLREITDRAICYVINTHVHPDHTLGNAAFRNDSPQFVGHARLPAAFTHNERFFLENFAADLDGADSPEALVPPDVLVSDTLELDLGGRTLELTAHPPGHTDQDLSVFDRKTGTLWLGFLFVQRIPALDGSLTGWIRVLESLKSHPADRVIPGNGPAPARWPDAAAAQLRYLQALENEIRTILQDDGFLEDALAKAGSSERGRWLLFDQHHGSNVTRAYTELEWE